MPQAPRDKAEIVRLYDDASPALRRVLQRKLGSRAEAEEIMHDAFEKLMTMPDDARIRDLRRYLFTMASNMATNALEHRNVEQRYLGAAGGTADLAEPDPRRAIEAGEALQRAQDALAGLPARTRHVFLLQRVDGNSYREIARQLGISRKGVEYHMRRAVAAVTGGVTPWRANDDDATPGDRDGR